MEMTQIIILSLIFLINLYILFFKSYFSEKGKNTATKEDIEDITRKIESVKIELEQLHSKKKEFLEQNKLALLSFFDEYINWNENTLKNIFITINDLYDPNTIREQINILNLQQLNVQKSFWRLCLFELQNTELVKEINEIYFETEKIHDATFEYLCNMEQLSNKIKIDLRGNITNEINKEYDNFTELIYQKRENAELKILGFPNKLMNLIRNRFLEIYQ